MNEGDLRNYARNRYSQSGEDGILEEILRRLEISQGWFVEFGAWDGKNLSNCFNLAEEKGWNGIFIEGDPARYAALEKLRQQFAGRVHTLCAMVGFAGDSRLDALLASTPAPREFEVLSIDIDSYDWEVWQALENYEPKVVVIESNSTFAPGIVARHNPPRNTGASFTALLELGAAKGYRLVCHTGNCIFVRAHLVEKLHLDPEFLASPALLFDRHRYNKERVIGFLRLLFPERLLQHAFAFSDRLKRALRRNSAHSR